MSETAELAVSSFSCFDERRIVIEYSGAPVMPTGVRGQFGFQPTDMILSYVRPNGEGWSCLSAEIYGPKLGKDGKQISSLITAKLKWFLRTDGTPDVPPEWVQVFIDKYLPADY